MSNPNRKVIRGAGKRVHWDFIHAHDQIKQVVHEWELADGTITQQQPKYPSRGKAHSRLGLDEWTERMKTFAKSTRGEGEIKSNCDWYSIIRLIDMLRDGDVAALINHATYSKKLLVTTAVYSITKDSHIKLYKYVGDEVDTHQMGFGYSDTWKSTRQFLKADAVLMSQWLRNNAGLIEAVYGLAKKVQTEHKMGQEKRFQTNQLRALVEQNQKLVKLEEELDENTVTWEAEQAWFKACPKWLAPHRPHNMRWESPLHQIGKLKSTIARMEKTQQDSLKQIESFEAIFGVLEVQQ